MSVDERFTLTDSHLKLLARMYVGWQDCESGAPEIDPKRPYGNSGVAGDVLSILGLPYDAEEPNEAFEDFARKIHRETATALQICLTTRQFAPGVYVRRNYRWERA